MVKATVTWPSAQVEWNRLDTQALQQAGSRGVFDTGLTAGGSMAHGRGGKRIEFIPWARHEHKVAKHDKS